MQAGNEFAVINNYNVEFEANLGYRSPSPKPLGETEGKHKRGGEVQEKKVDGPSWTHILKPVGEAMSDKEELQNVALIFRILAMESCLLLSLLLLLTLTKPINTNLKTLEWEAPRTPRFRNLPGEPLASPLPVLENRIMVENEMRYLGSPITTVPKLSQKLKLEDQEGISEEPMEFSLEDQGTKVCVLPTVSGKHRDLKYVTPDTVADLLSGKFQDLVEKFYIIDCRYPYEYLGGHILGALNLYSQKELHEFFLKKPVVPLDGQKRIIIVFLCEFSSERGPRMCRSLREKDRALNQYPALYYPELYILKGGYRDFFPEYMVKGYGRAQTWWDVEMRAQEPKESLSLSPTFQELCEPQSYCPMHHQDHQAELLRWRSQSKAQEGKRQLWEQIAVLVKDVRP
ncbi:M-phase inducer phosphatase 3 [Microtus ochrogaster]|uniref:M-phase inducer phosphatase n=1 Tax=Microtus ochrogaster TaxID=79684 RepID=A0A8J6G6Y5_MICOH|nr:M-phase inducer phosphatase 3 [Microtus ochrogaster]